MRLTPLLHVVLRFLSMLLIWWTALDAIRPRTTRHTMPPLRAHSGETCSDEDGTPAGTPSERDDFQEHQQQQDEHDNPMEHMQRRFAALAVYLLPPPPPPPVYLLVQAGLIAGFVRFATAALTYAPAALASLTTLKKRATHK
jgi:hypothetical protein